MIFFFKLAIAYINSNREARFDVQYGCFLHTGIMTESDLKRDSQKEYRERLKPLCLLSGPSALFFSLTYTLYFPLHHY